MSLKALMLTKNRQFITTFADAVAEMPLDWIVPDEVVLAVDFVKRERFDYLVADCTNEHGGVLIKAARQSHTNHDCVILGIASNPRAPTLPQLGADIYVDCSIDSGLLAASIRELLPLVTHHQRRSERLKTSIEVRLKQPTKELLCILLSLSEGGMMIGVEDVIRKFEVFQIFLPLPGITEEMQLYGKVAWHETSLTGVRFLGLTDDQKQQLRSWMQMRLRHNIRPDALAD